MKLFHMEKQEQNGRNRPLCASSVDFHSCLFKANVECVEAAQKTPGLNLPSLSLPQIEQYLGLVQS